MPPKRKAISKAGGKGNSPAKKAKAEESWNLSRLLTESSWRDALQGEMQKEYFLKLETTLDNDYKRGVQIFPPQDLIFNAFNLTPLSKVKVVILGQDPYHDDGQAHGLCFSVPKGVKAPPSLNNMFKELEQDISDFTTPSHGCLEDWAKEGVFLLNATLTVEAHKANSHKSYGWQMFTDEVIRIISAKCDKVVFLLWGNFAHKKEKLIDTNKHVVLKDAHPSPLSFGKFQNCKCFSKANDALVKAGLKPVNWKL
ncbi:uracil-DNA glycosylase-like isoform X2 [Babylonia areolata]|uniref:uracil-DNA glycosylase-like isoform X2 n=1 Tax=Babylonia areolata TaxID=304850 RepID=UPI003FCF01BB